MRFNDLWIDLSVGKYLPDNRSYLYEALAARHTLVFEDRYQAGGVAALNWIGNQYVYSRYDQYTINLGSCPKGALRNLARKGIAI